MNVAEVRSLFDDYIDEPDTTFLTVAQRRNYLSRAHEEYKRMIRRCDPDAFDNTADIVMTGGTEYDLALTTNTVRLLGNPAAGLTGPRLTQIKLVGVLDSGEIVQIVRAAQRLDRVLPRSVWTYSFPWTTFSYRLLGTRLLFDGMVTATLRLFYIGRPESGHTGYVDWTNDDPTAPGYVAEFIDDYPEFHETIAMLAAERYFIRDGYTSPEISNSLGRLRQEMYEQLVLQRNPESSRFTVDEYFRG